jgi:2,4-dienoyl-CoA reductase-like NADH-dependent reductase (Old Yellow Enzyme family)
MPNKDLLTGFRLSDNMVLKNRIIMAPMTRNMANNDLSPTQEMVDYYSRRASAGLIVTEGTIIRPDARGYSNVPGIFTKAHIDGWKRVTDAVHQNNGLIFLQIWHVGRVSHPHFLNGELPISASETTMSGGVKQANGLYYDKSRAVTVDEITDLIASYALAANNAITAGFDGVEIHGANGYLIDQFLHYSTNLREDNYGGTPANMARFALEVIQACGAAIGFHRVGLRISPGAYLNEIVGEKRDAANFEYLLTQLNHLPLAYIHTGNFDDHVKFAELDDKTMTEFIRTYYHGTVIACGGYSFEEAGTGIQKNSFDLIAFGRPFIANPDLITHLQLNQQVKSYEASMLSTLF